jgi:hypothetical protein
MQVSEQSDLRRACQAFIASAFAVLTEEHVLPTPVYHPARRCRPRLLRQQQSTVTALFGTADLQPWLGMVGHMERRPW